MGQKLREKVFAEVEGIMDWLNCGLMSSDPDGTLEFVNQRILDWLGYDRMELVGRPMAEMLPPHEIEEQVEREREAVLQGDVRMRLSMLRRMDSTTFPVLFLPQRIIGEDGEVEGTFSVILDMGAVETAKPVGYRAGDEVPERLERIARELQLLSQAADLPSGPAPLPLDHPELAELSEREREILSRLVVAERVPAIAKQLFISPHTVRGHLKSMFRKLGVSSQSDLVARVRALRRP